MEQRIVSVQKNRELWEEQDLTVTGTARGRAPLGIYFHLKKNVFFPGCEILEVMHMLRLAIVICFVTGENVLDIYCEKS